MRIAVVKPGAGKSSYDPPMCPWMVGIPPMDKK
jgi:hypothetical protein